MTLNEFSDEFDVLVQQGLSTSSTKDILTFNEYEKSIFLTKAQEQVVIAAYSGKNQFNDSFEETEEIRRYLSNLVKTYVTEDRKTGYDGISSHSFFFSLPEDLWFITYESVNLNESSLGCSDGKNITVVPITQDEYHRLKRNPFRRENKKRVLRLDVLDNVVELISDYDITSYLVRYVSKPSPIILIDLDNLSIDGINIKTECKLNPVIHRIILERAVKLALSSRTINTGNQ